MSQTKNIKKLANRLENASSVTERLAALTELQSLAKTEAEEVGLYALQIVIDQLTHATESEEYLEILDLMEKLVRSKNKEVNVKNSKSILAESRNVETLLELMGHDDITISIIASQILTELHANDGIYLEKTIQQCPNGLNKLLERLPDSSKEEVRNQAIVLIQELTVSNESMKNALVFQEGFEIIFNIIAEEGGAEDCGVVVQDCLKIARNMLNNSKIGQEFFFSMNSRWLFKLLEFFDPATLEKDEPDDELITDEDYLATPNTKQRRRADRLASGDGPSNGLWFQQHNRLVCAVLAVSALAASVGVYGKLNSAYQEKLSIELPSISSSLGSFLARRGPVELFMPVLALLVRITRGSERCAGAIGDALVKQYLSANGVNIPSSFLELGGVADSLQAAVFPQNFEFGMVVPQPNANNSDNSGKYLACGTIAKPQRDQLLHHYAQNRLILSLPALLCETYVFGGTYWTSDGSIFVDTTLLPSAALSLSSVVGGTVSGADVSPAIKMEDLLEWILGDIVDLDDDDEEAGEGSPMGLREASKDIVSHTGTNIPYSLLTYDTKFVDIGNVCLHALDEMMLSSNTICMMLIQHILAPPFMGMDDEMDDNGGLGSAKSKPLGLQLVDTVLTNVSAIIAKSRISGAEDTNLLTLLHQFHTQTYSAPAGAAPAGSCAKEICYAVRCLNILTVVFMRGDAITRELANRVLLSHCSVDMDAVRPPAGEGEGDAGTGTGTKGQPLFRFLLAVVAKRLLRIPECEPLIAALFKMLACSVHQCESASKQVWPVTVNLRTFVIYYIYSFVHFYCCCTVLCTRIADR